MEKERFRCSILENKSLAGLDEDFVAVVKDGAHGHPQRLAAAVGGEDVCVGEVGVTEPVVIGADRVEILGDGI